MKAHIQEEEKEGKEGRNLRWRIRQIELGQNTEQYQLYIKHCPQQKRDRGDPKTPRLNDKCSKKIFGFKLIAWRRGLHEYCQKHHLTSDLRVQQAPKQKSRQGGQETNEAQNKVLKVKLYNHYPSPSINPTPTPKSHQVSENLSVSPCDSDDFLQAPSNQVCTTQLFGASVSNAQQRSYNHTQVKENLGETQSRDRDGASQCQVVEVDKNLSYANYLDRICAMEGDTPKAGPSSSKLDYNKRVDMIYQFDSEYNSEPPTCDSRKVDASSKHCTANVQCYSSTDYTSSARAKPSFNNTVSSSDIRHDRQAIPGLQNFQRSPIPGLNLPPKSQSGQQCSTLKQHNTPSQCQQTKHDTDNAWENVMSCGIQQQPASVHSKDNVCELLSDTETDDNDEFSRSYLPQASPPLYQYKDCAQLNKTPNATNQPTSIPLAGFSSAQLYGLKESAFASAQHSLLHPDKQSSPLQHSVRAKSATLKHVVNDLNIQSRLSSIKGIQAVGNSPSSAQKNCNQHEGSMLLNSSHSNASTGTQNVPASLESRQALAKQRLQQESKKSQQVVHVTPTVNVNPTKPAQNSSPDAIKAYNLNTKSPSAVGELYSNSGTPCAPYMIGTPEPAEHSCGQEQTPKQRLARSGSAKTVGARLRGQPGEVSRTNQCASAAQYEGFDSEGDTSDHRSDVDWEVEQRGKRKRSNKISKAGSKRGPKPNKKQFVKQNSLQALHSTKCRKDDQKFFNLNSCNISKVAKRENAAVNASSNKTERKTEVQVEKRCKQTSHVTKAVSKRHVQDNTLQQRGMGKDQSMPARTESVQYSPQVAEPVVLDTTGQLGGLCSSPKPAACVQETNSTQEAHVASREVEIQLVSCSDQQATLQKQCSSVEDDKLIDIHQDIASCQQNDTTEQVLSRQSSQIKLALNSIQQQEKVCDSTNHADQVNKLYSVKEGPTTQTGPSIASSLMCKLITALGQIDTSQCMSIVNKAPQASLPQFSTVEPSVKQQCKELLQRALQYLCNDQDSPSVEGDLPIDMVRVGSNDNAELARAALHKCADKQMPFKTTLRVNIGKILQQKAGKEGASGDEKGQNVPKGDLHGSETCNAENAKCVASITEVARATDTTQAAPHELKVRVLKESAFMQGQKEFVQQLVQRSPQPEMGSAVDIQCELGGAQQSTLLEQLVSAAPNTESNSEEGRSDHLLQAPSKPQRCNEELTQHVLSPLGSGVGASTPQYDAGPPKCYPPDLDAAQLTVGISQKQPIMIDHRPALKCVDHADMDAQTEVAPQYYNMFPQPGPQPGMFSQAHGMNWMVGNSYGSQGVPMYAHAHPVCNTPHIHYPAPYMVPPQYNGVAGGAYVGPHPVPQVQRRYECAPQHDYAGPPYSSSYEHQQQGRPPQVLTRFSEIQRFETVRGEHSTTVPACAPSQAGAIKEQSVVQRVAFGSVQPVNNDMLQYSRMAVCNEVKVPAGPSQAQQFREMAAYGLGAVSQGKDGAEEQRKQPTNELSLVFDEDGTQFEQVFGSMTPNNENMENC